jgi:hypothetical protein
MQSRLCLFNISVMLGALHFAAAGRASAGVVLTWGGGYVSKTVSLNGDLDLADNDYDDPDDDGIRDGRIYDNLDPYSPLELDENNNPIYTGPEFYGGHALSYKSGTNDGLTNLEILKGGNNNSNDILSVKSRPDLEVNQFAMLVYWKLDPTKQFAVNGQSRFILQSTKDAGAKKEGHSLRWLIGIGENDIYLSSDEEFANNSVYGENSYLSGLVWGKYDVSGTLSSIRFTENSDSPLSLSNITKIGFYVQFDAPTNGGLGANKIDYKISGFTADLDPNGHTVPEPSTFALGLIGVTGAAVRRWRKRRGAKAEDAPAEPTAEPLSEVTL